MSAKSSLFTTIRQQRALIVILVVAVLLRLAAALYLGNEVEVLPGTFDQISYHNLALRVNDGHGFSFGQLWWPITQADAPTAHWSYLYTLYLTAVYFVFGPNPLIARLIQAFVVGLLHPYLAFRIGDKVFNNKIGLVAAGFTAIYAYFVYYSATLMTEPFYITAILASLFFTLSLAEGTGKQTTRKAAALGLALGITILLRQLFLTIVPFIFLWLWWARYRRFKRFPVRSSLYAIALMVVLVVPFTIYNYIRFDRFVLLNTNAGYAFFWGNHPIYGTKFEPILPETMGNYQDLIPEELRHLDEASLEQALLRRGLEFIVDDPIRYVQLSISRIPPYFMFWPSADSETVSNLSRLVSFGLFWPFMLYGVLLSFGKRYRSTLGWDRLLLLLSFCLLYSAIHVLTWTLIRYRLPVDAVLLIFAALGIVDLADRFSVWRRQQMSSRKVQI